MRSVLLNVHWRFGYFITYTCMYGQYICMCTYILHDCVHTHVVSVVKGCMLEHSLLHAG